MFIVIEGFDGCGKSVFAEYLTKALNKKYNALLTRQPGGTELAESIRNVIKAKYDEKVDKVTDYLLFSAARLTLINNVIKPVLAKGDIVVCDRHFVSSRAYQGIAIDEVAELTEFPADLTIFIDRPLTECIKSANSRETTNADDDRMEAIEVSKKVAIRDEYHKLINDSSLPHGEVIHYSFSNFKENHWEELLEIVINYVDAKMAIKKHNQVYKGKYVYR